MNLKKDGAFSHIALAIAIIALVGLLAVGIMFVFGEDGVITKVAEDEVEYNKTEVLEELDTIVTEIYLEAYKQVGTVEGATIETLYNSEIVINKLKEKGIIENYKNKDGEDAQNKYYIITKNFKRDIKNSIGENGTDKNIFILEKRENEYVVEHYDSKGEVQILGNLQIEKNI